MREVAFFDFLRKFLILFFDQNAVYKKNIVFNAQFSLVAQLVKNLPAMQETRFNYWVRKVAWRRNRLPTPVFMGFPGKESTYNAVDLGLIPRLGRSPGGEHGNPLQYSCLKSPHGQRSLVGYSSWGHKKSATTER